MIKDIVSTIFKILIWVLAFFLFFELLATAVILTGLALAPY